MNLPAPSLRAFIVPASQFDDRSTLADVSAELWAGRPAVLFHEGRWLLLTPESAAGRPPTRRLIDLPLVETEALAPDAPPEDALLAEWTPGLDVRPVVESGRLLGLVSRRSILEHVLAEAREASRRALFLGESAKVGRTLIWSLPLDPPGRIDPGGRLALAHGPFEAILGRGPLESIGGLAESVHPDDREGFEASMRELAARAGRTSRTYRVRGRRGWVWLQEEIWAETDADGRVVSITAVATDTSPVQRRLEHAVHSLPNGVVLLDDQGRILLANPRARSYLEFLKDPAAGSTIGTLGAVPLRPLLDSAEATPIELEIPGPPRRIFQVTAAPYSAEGPGGCRRRETALVLREVTLERENARRAVQQERLAALGELAGGVAHDFRNLLTAILGFQDLLIRGIAENDPCRRDAEAIGRAAARAVELTGQLLTFARQEPTRPRPIRLEALVDEMREMLERVIGDEVEFETRCSREPCWVEADPEQVERIVMNLVVNARDAMPSGGHLWIATTAESGSSALLEVGDTGCGMPPDVLARIFEPFFTTKDSGRGTGLGLSTVHGIAEQNGWTLEVQSLPGEGSTFRIGFPLLRHPGVPEPVPADPLETPPGEGTILVVEDEPLVRELVGDALRSHGYAVLEATDGLEGLAAFERAGGNVDLVLVDLLLPGLAGLDLAERIRARRVDARMLAMTGHEDAASLDPAATLFLDVIRKPFRPDELVRRVHRALGPAELGPAHRRRV